MISTASRRRFTAIVRSPGSRTWLPTYSGRAAGRLSWTCPPVWARRRCSTSPCSCWPCAPEVRPRAGWDGDGSSSWWIGESSSTRPSCTEKASPRPWRRHLRAACRRRSPAGSVDCPVRPAARCFPWSRCAAERPGMPRGCRFPTCPRSSPAPWTRWEAACSSVVTESVPGDARSMPP